MKELIPFKTPTGAVVYLESRKKNTLEENISDKQFSFETIKETISEIAEVIISPLKKTNAKKVSVEFGIEFSVESGKVITILAKGSLKSSFKISLEWDMSNANEDK